MAQTKKPKIFDITRKPKAEPTSRSIIISHNPIMHDPTIVEDQAVKTHDDIDDKLAVKVNRELKLEPPEQSEVKPDDEPTTPVKEQSGAQEESKPEVPKSQTGTSQSETDLTPISRKTDSSESSSITDKADGKQPDQENTSTEEEHSTGEKSKQQQAKDDEAATHVAKIAELVMSKKLFLPINMKEKRRNKKIVALGIIVAILLVIVWFDVALDAGIIHNSLNLPHTHFFTVKS
jgi:hypothetical protein